MAYAITKYTPYHIRGLSLRLDPTSPNNKLIIGTGNWKDDSFTYEFVETQEITVDITVSGAGGLDQGAEAADTWYYVWIILALGTTASKGLLSTSSTAPVMPEGYTCKRRIGSVRNDSSSNFIPFKQIGEESRRKYQYWENASALEVLSGGSAEVWTSVDISSLVPTTAKLVDLVASKANGGGGGGGEEYVDRGDPADWDFDLTDLTTDSNWHDLDLSGIVAAGGASHLVHILIYILDDTSEKYITFQEKGNVNSYNTDPLYTQVANIYNAGSLLVMMDGDRIIQYKTSNTTFSGIYILVRGWWKDSGNVYIRPYGMSGDDVMFNVDPGTHVVLPVIFDTRVVEYKNSEAGCSVTISINGYEEEL